jgi:hypothetical protein
MDREISQYNPFDAMEAIEEQYMFTTPGIITVTNYYIATLTTQHSQTMPLFPEPMGFALT